MHSEVRVPLLKRVFILLPMLVLSFHVATFGAINTLDDKVSRDNLLEELNKVRPDLADKVKEIFRLHEPLVVFVPGILGSRLFDKERNLVLWGKSPTKNVALIAERLSYCSGTDVEVSLLTKFDTAGWLDENIYGKWVRKLQEIKFTSDCEYLIFPYDWRKDIIDIAGDLNIFLTETHAKETFGRPIVFVAHSMGGLVVTAWYHTKYKAFGKNGTGLSFTVDCVYFLGTPHTGSASILHVLMNGYRTSNNRFIRWAQSSHVKGLDRVAHTFPSVYQLLPPENNKFIEYKNSDNAITPKNHFKATTWTDLKLLEDAQKHFRRPFACSSLQKLLNRGREFHRELDKAGPVPKSRYYYSVMHETLNKLTVNSDLEYDWIERKYGDGRILANSAMNEDRDNNSETRDLRGMDADEHGDLVDHPSFHQDLGQWLRRFTSKRDTAIFVLANLEQELKDLLFNLRINFKTPLAVDWTAALRPPLSMENLKMIEFNLKVASGGEAVSLNSEQARKLLRSRKIWSGNDTTIRELRRQNYRVLSDSSFDFKTRAWAANNLAHLAYEEGEYSISKNWSKIAKQFDRNIPLTNSDGELSGKIRINLGAAHIKLGEYQQAKDQFEAVVTMERNGLYVPDVVVTKARKNFDIADELRRSESRTADVHKKLKKLRN